VIKWRNSYTSYIPYIHTQTCIPPPQNTVDCCMLLVILHAEIVLCSFGFVMLPCVVIFLFHCSLKSEDLPIKVALIKKYLLKTDPH
jgi:hypothetical protein